MKYIEVATLPAGCSYGELALIRHKPRAATIRATEDCHFAVLEKIDYQKVFGKIQEKILNQKIDFLKSVVVFKSWNRVAVAKLTYYFKEVELLRGHYLYREGEPCRQTFVIQSGSFEATKNAFNDLKITIQGNRFYPQISNFR